MMAARRASTSAPAGGWLSGGVIVMRPLFVDGARVFQDRLGTFPGLAGQPLVKAAVAAGVASDGRIVPLLGDFQQHDVVVAIEADVVHHLHVARFLALVPETRTRA